MREVRHPNDLPLFILDFLCKVTAAHHGRCAGFSLQNTSNMIIRLKIKSSQVKRESPRAAALMSGTSVTLHAGQVLPRAS